MVSEIICDDFRYLEIVEKEGLEISQPALDPQHSEVHHQITIRMPRALVHRYIFFQDETYKRLGVCCHVCFIILFLRRLEQKNIQVSRKWTLL